MRMSRYLVERCEGECWSNPHANAINRVEDLMRMFQVEFSGVQSVTIRGRQFRLTDADRSSMFQSYCFPREVDSIRLEIVEDEPY